MIEPEFIEPDVDLIDEDPPEEPAHPSLPVSVMNFADQAFSARCVGISLAPKLRAGKQKGHDALKGDYAMFFIPTVQQFRIEWTPPGHEEATVGFIPVTNVAGWLPLKA